MGKLILSAFMTVNGIMEAPGFDEHRDGRNGWALRLANEETQRHNLDQLLSTDALLLGRKTYQIWAAFWPSAGGASLARAGVDIRTAIHTGEIEVREGDVGGIGVHIASRALSEAGARQIVVTRTVRDFATGTDLAFNPLGTVGLRGVPGEWQLFEASVE